MSSSESAPNRTDDPLTGGPSEVLQRTHQNALRAFLRALSLAIPLIAVGVYLREGVTPLLGVALGLVLAAWGCLWLFQRGQVSLAAHLAIFTVLAGAVGGVVADGSVRSSAVMVMFAGVVAAGTFLPVRSMYLAGGLSLLALALLNAADALGWLRTPNLRTGWVVWATQTTVLVSVMVSVFHGRRHLRAAFSNQEEALQRAQQVEAHLRDSEARVSALFKNNPVACLVQSVEQQGITDANDAFCKLFGYRRDELLGRDLPGLWADPGDLLEYQNKLRATRRVQGMSALGRRTDGSTFDAQVFAEVVRHGNEHLVITLVLDVSTERASRIELEKSHDRFIKAFNFSPLGMTIAHLADGRYVEVNPAYEHVLGYTQADLLGHTSLEVGLWLAPEDRQVFIDQLRREGHLRAYETRMRSKTGEAVDVRIWAELIELEDTPCVMAYALNVADQKRREAMLLNLAEGVSGETGEAFFRSLAGHLAQACGADGVMLGELDSYRRLRTLAVLWDGQLQPNAEHELSFTLFEQALAQREMLLLEHPRPQPMPLLPPFRDAELQAFAGLPLRDGDDSAAGLLALVWRQPPKITEDVQALLTIFASRCNAELMRLRRDREIRSLHETLEQRVQARTEQLQYLNQELDAFAYTVSHDLKSPLRAIDGFMSLLKDQTAGRLQPDDDDLIERVLASATRMNGLITDLLSLARVSQGQLQRMEVNLSDLAEGVMRQERHRDPTREVEIIITPDLSANCDPRLAQVVLENLMGNAWKYTRQQARPRIEFGQAPTALGEPPQFFIRDNGAGFDMGRSDRLFKPFTRLHSPKEFEGTGIGLATVRRIVERHGGQIHAKGAVGQGATFWFSFGRPGSD